MENRNQKNPRNDISESNSFIDVTKAKKKRSYIKKRKKTGYKEASSETAHIIHIPDAKKKHISTHFYLENMMQNEILNNNQIVSKHPNEIQQYSFQAQNSIHTNSHFSAQIQNYFQFPNQTQILNLAPNQFQIQGEKQTKRVCVSVATQTEDNDKTKMNILPLFETQKSQSARNKRKINNLISDFNKEIRKYKAFLTTAQIEELNEFGIQKCDIKYSRGCLTKTIEDLIYQSLYAKDECNISDFHYNLFKKILELPIASLYQVIKFRRQLDAKFALNKNPYGFYLDPLKKIIFVLKYYIPNNQIQPGELIKIKLVGDGVNVTKKHTNLFNFAFTIIGEVKRNKSCRGNYILGNYNHLSGCTSKKIALY